MHTTPELVSCLNRIYGRIWDSGWDLIANLIIHRLSSSLSSIGGVRAATLTMSMPPHFELLPGDTVQAKLPRGAGPPIGLPGYAPHIIDLQFAAEIGAHIELSLVGQLHPSSDTAWQSFVTVTVNLPWWWYGVAIATVNIGLLVTLRTIETALSIAASQIANDNLVQNLGGLNALRFNRTSPFLPSGVTVEPEPGVKANAWQTPLYGADQVDWLNVAFIADNYDPTNIAEFEGLFLMATEKLTQGWTGDDSSYVYAAHGTVIRTFKLPLVGTGEGEWMATQAVMDGIVKSVFANLARLAESYLQIEELLSHEYPTQRDLRTEPIIVIVRRYEDCLSPDDGQLSPCGSSDKLPRAIAMGNIIILPIMAGSGDFERAVRVLNHEIGHVFGLADEYVRNSERYSGTPLIRNVNVAVSKEWAYLKWWQWIVQGRLSMSAITEGAQEFQFGLFRPTPGCKMNLYDRDVDFCPICRDTISGGLLHRLGYKNAPVTAPLTVQIEYLGPWKTDPKTVTIGVPLRASSQSAVSPVRIPLEVAPLGYETKVHITPIRAAVPDWVSEFSAGSNGIIRVKSGDVVTLRLASDPSSKVPPELRDGTQVVEFSFELAPSFQLLPPRNLQQNVPIGQQLIPQIDETNGDILLGLELKAAQTQAVLDMEAVFEFTRPDGMKHSDSRRIDPSYPIIKVQPAALPPGSYRWRARTVLVTCRAIVSSWAELPLNGATAHFTVSELPEHSNPRPMKPFDLSMNTLYTRYEYAIPAGSSGSSGSNEPLIIASQDSARLPSDQFDAVDLHVTTDPYYWVHDKLQFHAQTFHTNGESIWLEFEYTTGDFSGTPTFTTDPLIPSGYATLAVNGSVTVQVAPDFDFEKVKWRVRAKDAAGRVSDWADSDWPYWRELIRFPKLISRILTPRR